MLNFRTSPRVPTPLPASLLADGPAAWKSDAKPVGTLTYHSPQGKPFTLLKDVGPAGKVLTPTITRSLFFDTKSPFMEVVGDFEAAVAQAAAKSQTNNVATAVMQSRAGVYYTQQLVGGKPVEAPEPDLYRLSPVGIDRGLPENITRVVLTSTNPALHAIVGATSMVDFRRKWN